MSIETTLFDTINDDAAVTALISGRVYAQVAPDNAAVPYVTTQLIANEPHSRVNGSYNSERKVFQVNCVSNSYENAKAVAEAIKAAITPSIGYLNGEGDDYFAQTERHRVYLDFSLIG